MDLGTIGQLGVGGGVVIGVLFLVLGFLSKLAQRLLERLKEEWAAHRAWRTSEADKDRELRREENQRLNHLSKQMDETLQNTARLSAQFFQLKHDIARLDGDVRELRGAGRNWNLTPPVGVPTSGGPNGGNES